MEDKNNQTEHKGVDRSLQLLPDMSLHPKIQDKNTSLKT